MFATYTSQEMKGFLMPGSKSSENILSRFCPVAFVIYNRKPCADNYISIETLNLSTNYSPLPPITPKSKK